MNTSIKERTLAFIKFKGITMKEFEAKCNLSTGYVTSMRKGYGPEKLSNVLSAFPDLNRDWLLYNEGEMLNTPSASAPKEKRGALTQKVQYFPEVEATGGHMDLYEDRKENSVSLEIPKSFDCDYALNLAGDSMAPLYNPGCIILIKRWTERFIEYGRVYLIVTKMGNRMVKYIRPASDEAYIICASENPAYPPFEVAREDILALYAVKGCIFQHSM